MEPLIFPGEFWDQHGKEPIQWRILSNPSSVDYEIFTTIRGVDFRGYNFDGLEPLDAEAALKAALSLDEEWGELIRCTLSGELPCQPSPVTFVYHLSGDPDRSMTLRTGDREVTGNYDFETGLKALGLDNLVCCLTCNLSDYSPFGKSLMGMLCFRENRAQYLAAREKEEFQRLAVTEEVPETYLCPDNQPRIPGTGYRG